MLFKKFCSCVLYLFLLCLHTYCIVVCLLLHAYTVQLYILNIHSPSMHLSAQFMYPSTTHACIHSPFVHACIAGYSACASCSRYWSLPRVSVRAYVIERVSDYWISQWLNEWVQGGIRGSLRPTEGNIRGMMPYQFTEVSLTHIHLHTLTCLQSLTGHTPAHPTNTHTLIKHSLTQQTLTTHSPSHHHAPMIPPFAHILTMYPYIQRALTMHSRTHHALTHCHLLTI